MGEVTVYDPQREKDKRRKKYQSKKRDKVKTELSRNRKKTGMKIPEKRKYHAK